MKKQQSLTVKKAATISNNRVLKAKAVEDCNCDKVSYGRKQKRSAKSGRKKK